MRKQKLLLPALLLFGSFLASCTKEGNTSPEKLSMNQSIAGVNGEAGTLDVVDTFAVKTALRAAPWTYYEVFGNYLKPAPTPPSKLLYKYERAAELNILSLKNDITTYNQTKNTFIETIPGAFNSTITIEGYFYFTYMPNTGNSEVVLNTVITSPNEYKGTSSAHLVRLPDNINYAWYNETIDRFGIMYHPNTIPVSGTTSVESRLTGKIWQYENYFNDYALADCNLLFRMNRPGGVKSAIDLSALQVYFKADSSYTETTLVPGGTNIVKKGKWWLSDNKTRLHTKLDELSFESVAEIRLLNDNRFQWATLPGGGTSSRAATNPITYADMVIQGTTLPKTRP